MYATVDIDIGAPQAYVTLPQTAIAYNPYGDTVYRGREQGQRCAAASRSSSPGRPSSPPAPTRGDQVAILRGVKEGDTVVTAGQIKLHNGSPVMIDNTRAADRRTQRRRRSTVRRAAP